MQPARCRLDLCSFAAAIGIVAALAVSPARGETLSLRCAWTPTDRGFGGPLDPAYKEAATAYDEENPFRFRLGLSERTATLESRGDSILLGLAHVSEQQDDLVIRFENPKFVGLPKDFITYTMYIDRYNLSSTLILAMRGTDRMAAKMLRRGTCAVKKF